MKIILSTLIFFGFNQAFAAEAPKATKSEKVDPAIETIELRVELVNGKKHWMPEKLNMSSGTKKLVLKNTLPEPHGFAIAGVLKEPVVVQTNQNLELTVDFPKTGSYAVTCHLHPAHVGASIEVK